MQIYVQTSPRGAWSPRILTDRCISLGVLMHLQQVWHLWWRSSIPP